ncbi:hypothetical protein XA26_22940 [Mycolicibacterium fortuitum]|uniref:Uncharacterized protein n=1 Tax=Mycolicibacterium fortuitum TaxID=1766 RepID=A0A0N9XF44_MYCFO|nr:hypothetical protein G155_00116 [Mycobacterium sp. VKM Ac-1817D]ALI26139.1 hypothetical protein XA26_22940 [Mycolicibacterium fortuitum]
MLLVRASPPKVAPSRRDSVRQFVGPRGGQTVGSVRIQVDMRDFPTNLWRISW